MALFEAMRENTKVVLWITVVAFVGLIFLAWGADFTSRGPSGQGEPGVLATVNDQRLMIREYSDALVRTRMLYEMQTGSRPDDAMDLMMQTTTWSNLIDRILVREQVVKRGIRVTDREVALALLNNPLPSMRNSPTFQTDGQFDLQKYQGYLADPRTNTLPLEMEQRDLVAFEKLQLLMFSGVKVSPGEVHEAWLNENETLDLAYALVSYYKMPAPEEVADAELDAHLQAHPEKYQHPERVAIAFISLPKEISGQDSLEAQTDMRDARRELERGEEFEVIVQIYSHAAPSRSGGERALFLTREAISQPEVSAAAFSLAVGEVSEVISSSDGLHLIKVVDRQTEDDAEQVKLAEVFIPLQLSYESNMAIRDRAVDFADTARVVGFGPTAEKIGLQVSSSGLCDPAGFIPGLGSVSAAKDFARRAAVGDVSKPIQTGNAWYVLHLAERQAPRLAPLADVRTRVRTDYLLEGRKSLATEQAAAILARCQAGRSLEEAAQQESLAVYNMAEAVTRLGYVRGIGSDPQLTAAAFSSGPGLVPRVISGNQGAYVIENLKRATPADSAFAVAMPELRQRLVQEKQSRLIREWMQQLRDEAVIEDYRIAISSM